MVPDNIRGQKTVEELKEEYINNPKFLDFVSREFESTASNATIEELAEFAFGSIEEAIKEFKDYDTGGE